MRSPIWRMQRRSYTRLSMSGGQDSIFAVLDIDSENLATFDETDKEWLEKTVSLF